MSLTNTPFVNNNNSTPSSNNIIKGFNQEDSETINYFLDKYVNYLIDKCKYQSWYPNDKYSIEEKIKIILSYTDEMWQYIEDYIKLVINLLREKFKDNHGRNILLVCNNRIIMPDFLSCTRNISGRISE